MFFSPYIAFTCFIILLAHSCDTIKPAPAFWTFWSYCRYLGKPSSDVLTCSRDFLVARDIKRGYLDLATYSTLTLEVVGTSFLLATIYHTLIELIPLSQSQHPRLFSGSTPAASRSWQSSGLSTEKTSVPQLSALVFSYCEYILCWIMNTFILHYQCTPFPVVLLLT